MGLTELLKLIPDTIFEIRPDGTLVNLIHTGFSNLISEEKKRVVNRVTDFIPEDYYPHFQKLCRQALSSGESTCMEFRVGKTNEFQQLFEARLLSAPQGTILCICRNITQRKPGQEMNVKGNLFRDRVDQESCVESGVSHEYVSRDVIGIPNGQAASKGSLCKYRLWVDSAPVGILETRNGKIIYANRSLSEALDYQDLADLRDMELMSFVSEPSLELARSIFSEERKSSLGDDYYDLELVGRNGTKRSVCIWPREIDESGEKSTLCFMIDRTQEKLLGENLIHSQKLEAIGTLAGGIAHDFNNVLTSIMGYTQLAFDKVPKGSSLSSYLKHVMDASDRASELVNHILSFSRETAREKQPLLIGPILKESLRFLRASVPMTIEFRQDIAPNLNPICGVTTQIHQVIMNLCTNAAHSMKNKGGRLSVSLNEVSLSREDISSNETIAPGNFLKLTVSDTGHGISPELSEKIFDPYFTTKKSGEGSGLGLSIVRNIVKDHDGIIKVRSEENVGSTFEVYLPVCADRTDHQDEQEAIIPSGHGRIMVVDDEPDIVTMLPQMLRNLGYDSIAKRSPLEALETFSMNPFDFDLVITDMTMPQMTGLQLCLALKKIRSDIPVILMTGFSDLLDEKKAHEFGVNELIYKPVRKTVLSHIIYDTLDRK